VKNRVRLFFFKPNKKTLTFEAEGGKNLKTINFCGKLSSPCLLFFLGTSTFAAHNFTISTCTTIIITLEPYALNVKLQHFTPRFNKISLLYGYH
jgi:hypothetical protein